MCFMGREENDLLNLYTITTSLDVVFLFHNTVGRCSIIINKDGGSRWKAELQL